MTKRYAFLIGSLLFGAFSFLQAQSGTLDPSFNGTGYVIDPVNNLDAGRNILVQPDQKILLIGMSFDAQYVARAQVYRYNPDGSQLASASTVCSRMNWISRPTSIPPC